jgi:hypothetical protein
MWAQAARWPGPEDDAGYRDALTQGILSDSPATVRGRVRDWLTTLLAAERVGVELPEPADWLGWDAEHRR